MKKIQEPHDVTVILSISRKVIEKLKALGLREEQATNKCKAIKGFLPALIHAKEKGYGIATSVRIELHEFSVSSIYSFEMKKRPFLDFNTNQLKLRLDGVASCLAGDFSCTIQLRFYHPISGMWEHVIEPFPIHADVTQMPDEQIIKIKSPETMNINVTGHLLKEMSNLDRARKHGNSSSDSPNKVGVSFTNCTGIDLIISLNSSTGNNGIGDFEHCVKSGDCVVLESVFSEMGDIDSRTASLRVEGQKLSLSNLPLKPSPEHSTLLYKWPLHSNDELHQLDPVVESVMQNQRLRFSVVDINSIDRGTDLLSSTIWSPDNSNDDKSKQWIKPYLEGDAPEYSDMTCTVKRTKDSIHLPGYDWTWANDWEVETIDGLGQTTDADGWQYSSDFETFTGDPRYYKNGDTCRRRRWTRTRIMKTKGTDRSFRLVWELRRDENGCVAIKAKSHLSVANNTPTHLVLFGYCASWEVDQLIAVVNPGSTLDVSIQLANATHIRLGVPKDLSFVEDESTLSINDCFSSGLVMILPSGIDRVIRTSILCDGTSTDRHGLRRLTTLHFLLRLKTSEAGVAHIIVDPAARLINLLPCHMQCQLGESVGRRAACLGKQVVQTEELAVPAGKEANCMSLDCRLKPRKPLFLIFILPSPTNYFL